jgi:hypothetical protein
MLPLGGIKSLRFCPYEDVLGVGCAGGISSLLVPGAGEPNFDSFVANPFQNKKERQEQEVVQLLDKLQPDTIMLDPEAIAKVGVVTSGCGICTERWTAHMAPHPCVVARKYSNVQLCLPAAAALGWTAPEPAHCAPSQCGHLRTAASSSVEGFDVSLI